MAGLPEDEDLRRGSGVSSTQAETCPDLEHAEPRVQHDDGLRTLSSSSETPVPTGRPRGELGPDADAKPAEDFDLAAALDAPSTPDAAPDAPGGPARPAPPLELDALPLGEDEEGDEVGDLMSPLGTKITDTKTGAKIERRHSVQLKSIGTESFREGDLLSKSLGVTGRVSTNFKLSLGPNSAPKTGGVRASVLQKVSSATNVIFGRGNSKEAQSPSLAKVQSAPAALAGDFTPVTPSAELDGSPSAPWARQATNGLALSMAGHGRHSAEGFSGAVADNRSIKETIDDLSELQQLSINVSLRMHWPELELRKGSARPDEVKKNPFGESKPGARLDWSEDLGLLVYRDADETPWQRGVAKVAGTARAIFAKLFPRPAKEPEDPDEVPMAATFGSGCEEVTILSIALKQAVSHYFTRRSDQTWAAVAAQVANAQAWSKPTRPAVSALRKAYQARPPGDVVTLDGLKQVCVEVYEAGTPSGLILRFLREADGTAVEARGAPSSRSSESGSGFGDNGSGFGDGSASDSGFGSDG